MLVRKDFPTLTSFWTESSSVKELNTIDALLLHKGQGKSRTSDINYRTFPTCPGIAEGLYIHDLFINLWNDAKAPTHYQGEGSSHELASLLITESIQQSLNYHHKPVYLLFLDARAPLTLLWSAFWSGTTTCLAWSVTSSFTWTTGCATPLLTLSGRKSWWNL